MSNLQYKFIACSDIHAYARTVNGVTIIPAPIRAYLNELENDTDIRGIMCCGDVNYNSNGIFVSTGEKETGAKTLLNMLAQATDNSLVCAGNHSSALYYGYKSLKTGVEDFNEVCGFSGYDGDEYVNVRVIEGDVFIAVSDVSGVTSNNEFYDTDTINHVLGIIDTAIQAGKRVFVFTHYPYCCIYNNGVVSKDTAKTINGDRFALRVSHGSSTNLSVYTNYPTPMSNGLLQQLAQKRVIWFSGHLHNWWQMGHQNGIILHNDGAVTSNGYSFAANTDYRVRYPFGKACEVGVGENKKAYMVNLPSVGYNLQDALVEVYDDHVEIIERQYAKQVGTSYDIDGYVNTHTHDGVTYTETDSGIPGVKTVTAAGVTGTTIAPNMSVAGTVVGEGKWTEMTGVMPHIVNIKNVNYTTGSGDEPDNPETYETKIYDASGHAFTSLSRLRIRHGGQLVQPSKVYDCGKHEINIGG